MPKEYLTYERKVIRYLQATKWKYAETHPAIMNHYNWTIETTPWICPNQEVMDMCRGGYLYIHKRDKRGRMIVVMNVCRMSKMNEE